MSKNRNLADLLDASGDVKSGSLDNVTIADNAVTMAKIADADIVTLKSGRKNLLINGGFDVWQRSETGAAVNAYIYASADRWEMVRSSLDKATDSNGKTYAKVVCGNWADNNYIDQKIEATGMGLGGKNITFSFNINSLTLSDGRVYIRSSANGGSSWSTVIWDGGTFTYNSTDTRYSFTGTVPNGAIDLIQVFIYGHRGTTNENGEYFNVSDVQLELGSVATDFEHRSYGEELALCQRYYETGEDFSMQGYGSVATVDSGAYAPAIFAVKKRAIPSFTEVSKTLAGNPVGYSSGVSNLSKNGFRFQYFHGGSSGSGNLGFTLDWAADAEL